MRGSASLRNGLIGGVGLTLLVAAFSKAELPLLEKKCINDHAKLVGKQHRDSIETICKQASSENIDMMVVTVESIKQYQSSLMLNVDRFVGELFDQWDVGYEARGNAIMFFVSREDRQFRVLVGNEYKDQLQELAGKIIQQTLLPAFRKGSGSSGILQTYRRLFREVAVPRIREMKKALHQPTPQTIEFD